MRANRARIANKLHRLTVRDLLNAGDGDHSDRGGLLLRLRKGSASWVFRFTSLSGRRREIGLGAAALGSSAQAGASLTGARKRAQDARTQLEHHGLPHRSSGDEAPT